MKETVVMLIWLFVFICDIVGMIVSVDSHFKLESADKWMARLMFVISLGGAVSILRYVWGVF